MFLHESRDSVPLKLFHLNMKALETYYPLIGRVVVHFQDVDMVVNMAMAGLLNEDPNVTKAFMAILPFAKKLDVLKAVAPFKLGSQDLLARLDSVLQLLSKAEEGRNRVVHAAWIGLSGSDTVFFHKPRVTRKAGMRDEGVRHATTAEIEDVLNSIESAMKALCGLLGALQKAKVLNVKIVSTESAASNGGAATQLGNSGVTEGAPSGT